MKPMQQPSTGRCSSCPIMASDGAEQFWVLLIKYGWWHLHPIRHQYLYQDRLYNSSNVNHIHFFLYSKRKKKTKNHNHPIQQGSVGQQLPVDHEGFLQGDRSQRQGPGQDMATVRPGLAGPVAARAGLWGAVAQPCWGLTEAAANGPGLMRGPGLWAGQEGLGRSCKALRAMTQFLIFILLFYSL